MLDKSNYERRAQKKKQIKERARIPVYTFFSIRSTSQKRDGVTVFAASASNRERAQYRCPWPDSLSRQHLTKAY